MTSSETAEKSKTLEARIGEWIAPVVLLGVVPAITLVIIWSWFSHPALSIMVDVGVALGTGALAAAAIFQTVGENRRVKVDERNRLADRAPHLRIMTAGRMATYLKDSDAEGAEKGAKVPFSRTELDVFAENVGPGIAGGLSAALVCVFFDFEPTQEGDDEAEYPTPRKMLEQGPSFARGQVRLPSELLPVGADNRMQLFNADTEAAFQFEENMRDSRAFIVELKGEDLEKHPTETVRAVIYWIPPYPKSWGIDESEYLTTSRWRRATSDTESAILAAWEKWQARPKTPPKPAAPSPST